MNRKTIDIFDAVAAKIKDSPAPDRLDLGALIAEQMKKPAEPDPDFDAALQATPQFQKYKETPFPAADSGWEEFIAHATLMQEALQAGRALKQERDDDWLAKGCPSKRPVAVSTPLKLRRAAGKAGPT